MFTQHTPHTGRTLATPRPRRVLRGAGMLTALAVGMGLTLATPLAASASDVPSSYARGQFLSGSIAGTDLAGLVALASAEARNDGTQAAQTVKDQLTASVLQAIKLNLGSGVQLNLGDFLDAGVLHQYASANKDGSSLAAAGAVADDGMIGVGQVKSGTAGNLNLGLSRLLAGRFASVLTELSLEVDAAAAQARGSLDTASGSYSLAGMTLRFTSPAIAGLTGKVATALAPINTQLGQLNGPNGTLASTVNSVVSGINPLLNIVGSSANVSATIGVDLNAAVTPLLRGNYGNGAVSFNLETGSVVVDLAKLLGGDLNSKPVGTEVLSAAVVTQILTGITDTVSTLSDQIVQKVDTALRNARVDVDVDLNLLTDQAPLLGQSCTEAPAKPAPAPSAPPSSGGGLGGLIGGIVGGVGGLVGGLTGGGTSGGGLGGVVGGLVCTATQTALPQLNTSLSVDVHGSVRQILAGTADHATATLTLLGLPVTVDVNSILNGLTGSLTDALFSPAGAATTFTTELRTQLLNPAITGLLGPGTSSVSTVLADILSVKINLRETSYPSTQGRAAAAGALFTQSAVRVSVLRDVGASGLATINLAAATVGPNVTRVVDPGDPGNPGGPGDPGTPGNPGNPGNPQPSAFTNLATTGVNLFAIINLVLALLAAGVYLAREGYRRRQSRAIG